MFSILLMLSGVLGFQIQPWGRMGWIIQYIFQSSLLGGLAITNEEMFWPEAFLFLNVKFY